MGTCYQSEQLKGLIFCKINLKKKNEELCSFSRHRHHGLPSFWSSGTCQWLSGTCQWLSGTCQWISGSCQWLSGTCQWLSSTCQWLSGSCQWLSGTNILSDII